MGKHEGEYSPSIVQQITDTRCFLCGRSDGKLDRHEIFHGTAFRQKSKIFGLWVTLCHPCHMVLHHMKRSYDYRLKRLGQRKAMQEFNWTTEMFIKQFGKNYLEEEKRDA